MTVERKRNIFGFKIPLGKETRSGKGGREIEKQENRKKENNKIVKEG